MQSYKSLIYKRTVIDFHTISQFGNLLNYAEIPFFLQLSEKDDNEAPQTGVFKYDRITLWVITP